jgi:NAD-dependent DNA ligase
MPYQPTEVEELWRRMQQFLMNSFLYYELNENIISDHDYDYLCKRMVELLQKYPEEASKMPYYDLVGGADSSGSGFYIKKYPIQIQNIAFKMLWMHRKKNKPDFNEDFIHFIARWGRSIER